jgi:hypothetical protein
MSEEKRFRVQLRRTAILAVGLFAALVFGIIVLANEDWIPGAVIVVASLVGLAGQIPVIRRLCATPAQRPPRSTPTG